MNTTTNKREKYLYRIELMKEFIRAYWLEHHFSPDTQETCNALGGLSTSMVAFYRERLEVDGWLEVQPKPRLPRSFVPSEIFRDRPVFPIPGMDHAVPGGDHTVVRQVKYVQVGSEIPPLDPDDFNHMPMIHYEKE